MSDSSNPYNLCYPSPMSLVELASKEIALILWRREIQQNITEAGTLRERYPRKKFSLKCLIPEIPSAVLPLIEKHVYNLSFEITNWLSYHSQVGILKINVLRHFLNFVWDFNGRIHFGRTAKRFVACNGISYDDKFKMACQYCLEDDILKIRSNVSSRISTNGIDFHHQPQYYYWVCRLRNQSPNVALGDDASCVEELILQVLYMNQNLKVGEWPALEYFLNRLSSEIATKNMASMASMLNPSGSGCGDEFTNLFLEYVLPKFNKPELKKLVNEKGEELISYMWDSYILRIWAFIKNEITDDGFCRLVKYILECKIDDDVRTGRYYWCELWASTADHLKQAAIERVFFFVDSWHFYQIPDAFLSAVLADIAIDDRRIFWNEHWETLIVYNKIPDEVRVLMNLCFNHDEKQMSRFKEDVKSNIEYGQKIHSQLKTLLGDGSLPELEKFLTFWYPNEQTIREIRLKLLHDDFVISTKLVCKTSALDEFINSAYEDRDLAIEFKNTLLVIPEMKAIENLKTFMHSSYKLFRRFRNIMEFVDTFAPSDEVLVEIKNHVLVPRLESALIKGLSVDIHFSGEEFRFHGVDNFDELEVFINWLLSCDEIAQFKETLNVDAIIEKLIQEKAQSVDRSKEEWHGVDGDWFSNCFQFLNEPDSIVKKFLKWYFVSTEAVEEFEKKYAHDCMFNRLLL